MSAALRGIAMTRATLRENRDIEDTRYLKRLLDDCDGDISCAARIAGYDRTHFLRILKRLDIKRDLPPTHPGHSL